MRASATQVRRRLAPVLCILLASLSLSPSAGRAAEATFGDRTVGDSVESLDGALGRAVEERERQDTLFPWLKARLGRYPNFIADSEILLQARTFGFPLQQTDGEDAYAWTLGGKLRYRSGWWKDRLQLGAGLYMSVPIVSDDPRALTDLLREDDKGFLVFGEAFVRTQWNSNEATLGRLEIDLPYVNINDSRMTPNTFQGLFVKGVGRGVPLVKRVDWVAGYLTHIRPRNEAEFVSMAEQAGAAEGDQGLALLGFQVRPTERLSFGAYEYVVPQTFHTGYFSGDYLVKISANWALRFSGQVTWQGSIGDEQIGEFETWVYGLRAAGSFRSVTGWLGFTQVSDDSGIRNPYGSYPGYVSLMQSNFDRAGERAWVIGASFAPKLYPRWSGFFQLAHGDGGFDLAGLQRASEDEINLTVDYRIDEGRMRGFWFRVRGSTLSREGAPKRGYELRLVINYTLPVL